MRDVVFLLAVVAFFALAGAYVRGCEALVGGDRRGPGADAGAGAGTERVEVGGAR